MYVDFCSWHVVYAWHMHVRCDAPFILYVKSIITFPKLNLKALHFLNLAFVVSYRWLSSTHCHDTYDLRTVFCRA